MINKLIIFLRGIKFNFLQVLFYFGFTFIPWYILIFGGIRAKEFQTWLILCSCILFLIIPIFFILPIGLKKLRVLFFGSICLIFIFLISRFIFFPLQNNQLIQGNEKLKSIYSKDAIPSNFGFNLISEEDWIRIGTGVGGLLMITDEQKTFIEKYTENEYPKIRNNREFQNINSVVNIGLEGLFNPKMSGTHYFKYTPDNPEEEKLTVFLQGNACNFLIYPWIFKNLSESINQKIVFPSFGFGNWQFPGGMEAIISSINNFGTGTREINLIGLSNGGKGISPFIRDYGEKVKKVVYISAIFDIEIISDPIFIRKAQKMDGILIIHGEKDDRIPIENIHKAVEVLKKNKIKVFEIYYPNSDHFLLFDKEKEILNIIERFLNNEKIIFK